MFLSHLGDFVNEIVFSNIFHVQIDCDTTSFVQKGQIPIFLIYLWVIIEKNI